MTTALAHTSPADAFRSGAAELFHSVADMSLHELVDEFQRLSLAVEAGVTIESSEGYPQKKWNDAALLAAKQRGVVNGAARARFGISFDTHDRGDTSDGF